MNILKMIRRLNDRRDLHDLSDDQLKDAANAAAKELGRRGWKCYSNGMRRDGMRFSKNVEL